MPIFEYQCENCGVSFEKLVFPSEKDPVTCPRCGRDTVIKKISAPNLGRRSSDVCMASPPKGFS